MPFDPTDVDQIAAVEAARMAVKTETASTLAQLAQARDAEKARADGLAVELTTAKTTAEQALADYTAAKAAGESTAAELATLKTAAETAAKAADAAIVAALPEPLRVLVAGKTGADLKAAAEVLAAHAAKPVPGRNQGDGGASAEPTEGMLEWARSMGLGESTNPAGIVAAYNKIGPGRKLAATS